MAQQKDDPREPPVIPQSIPYIGHLLGLLTHGEKYMQNLREKYQYPIMTMDVMGKSLYIVMDPDLVLACQKSPKTLDFYPVMLQGFQRLANVDAEAMAIISKDLNRPGANYMSDEHKAEYAALAPDPALNTMNAAAMQRLTSLIITTTAAAASTIKL